MGEGDLTVVPPAAAPGLLKGQPGLFELDEPDSTTTRSRSIEEITHLLAVVDSESVILAELFGCVTRLAEIAAAKDTLGRLPANDVRAAMKARHQLRLLDGSGGAS